MQNRQCFVRLVTSCCHSFWIFYSPNYSFLNARSSVFYELVTSCCHPLWGFYSLNDCSFFKCKIVSVLLVSELVTSCCHPLWVCYSPNDYSFDKCKTSVFARCLFYSFVFYVFRMMNGGCVRGCGVEGGCVEAGSSWAGYMCVYVCACV